jgi:zinc D-Ala-D-Ala carboxypeptidase
MTLAPNFTLAELTASAWADRHGADNAPPAPLIPELTRTAAMLQRIRDFLSAAQGVDTPMIDLSGYRSPCVNRGIGSSDTSDHPRGMACDFKALRMAPIDVCRMLEPHLDELGIGQIINELTWVHVSTRRPINPVNRIITIDKLGTRVGIVPVRA